jgi:hypothetical protein
MSPKDHNGGELLDPKRQRDGWTIFYAILAIGRILGFLLSSWWYNR